MDDYYALLGVEPGAATEDIRAAYRAKKASLSDAENDESRAGASRLNKAWNVLSDPYQRGRYDEQRAQAQQEGDLEVPEPVAASSRNGRGTSRSQQSARARREMPQPTIALPPGKAWPENRKRIAAMSLDISVLLVLFVVGWAVVTPALAKHYQPIAYKEAQQLRQHKIPAAHDATTAANKKADAAEAKAKQPNATAAEKQAAKDARAAADKAKANEKKLNDQLSHDDGKITPIATQVIGVVLLIGTLYLVVPTMITGGQTIGKRVQHLRVLRADGAPLRFGDAVIRYGSVMLVTFALWFLLQILAPVVVLVGVTTWMRNRNHQGLQDRLAKTIVVADAQ